MGYMKNYVDVCLFFVIYCYVIFLWKEFNRLKIVVLIYFKIWNLNGDLRVNNFCYFKIWGRKLMFRLYNWEVMYF